jgi:hypothetical protein
MNLNLINDAWIDVITRKGKIKKVSIKDMFLNSCDYVDISGSFSNKFVVYNLLFSITQSALIGKVGSYDDWRNIHKNYIQLVLAYLSRKNIQKRFDFYSQEFFYNFNIEKVENLDDDKSNTEVVEDGDDEDSGENENSCENDNFINKPWKFFAKDKYSSGNNHTLWDYSVGDDLTDQQKVYGILKYNMLSPGHQNNGISTNKIVTKWGRNISAIEVDSKEKKMCFSPYRQNSVITYLRGTNIEETIWLNLLPENFVNSNGSPSPSDTVQIDMGKPIWENKPSSIDDNESIKNLQTTYLGNKMPLYALTHYNQENNSVIYSPMVKKYEPLDVQVLYPHMTINTRNDKQKILKLSKSKNLLRDFPLILLRNSTTADGSAYTFNTPIICNLNKIMEYASSFFKDINLIKIVCGGIYDKSNSSVCMMEGEVSYEVPFNIKQISSIVTFIDQYKKCLNPFEKIEKNIFKAIAKYSFFHLRFDKKNSSEDVKMVNKIIKNLWGYLCNKYSKIIEISNSLTFDELSWNKEVAKMWECSVKDVVPSTSDIVKMTALVYAGKSIIYGLETKKAKSNKQQNLKKVKKGS